MKQNFSLKLIVFCLTTSIHVASFSSSFQNMLSLEWIKSGVGVDIEFLRTLRTVFNRNIFIETGTYGGETTERAAHVFDEVHSIELFEKLYLHARNMFRANNKIHMYHGDSGNVLKNLLPTIKNKKLIFWLDAHYCGEGTGRKSEGSDSPVLQELYAIKINNITDAVILIDDMRGFYSAHWPSLLEVVNALLEINPEYKFLSHGDTFIAYPQDIQLNISPLLQACTVSRLYNCGYPCYELEQVLKAEEIIANCHGRELDILHRLTRYTAESDDQHFILWQGLVYKQNGKFSQACDCFKKILDSTQIKKINHDRVRLYNETRS